MPKSFYYKLLNTSYHSLAVDLKSQLRMISLKENEVKKNISIWLMWSVCSADFYDVAEHKLLALYRKSVNSENLISMSTVNPEQSDVTWVNVAYFKLSATAFEKKFFNHRHP